MPPEMPGADARAAGLAGQSEPERGRANPAAPELRPAASKVVSALARAVQAFHTYPARSPARDDVIQAVQRALADYDAMADGPIRIDVTSDGFSWRELPIGGDPGSERALLLALRKGYTSSIELDTDAPARDLREFSALLAFPEALLQRTETPAEILANRGVTGVRIHVIPMHQTIELGSIPAPVVERIDRARELRGGEEVQAEGGWVRVDPGVGLTRLDLGELAQVLPDGSSLGVALQQMAGKHRDEIVPSAALMAHFDEIVELYEAADPGLIDGLFQRLAAEVERLPEEARDQLLRDEILPGLVDGHGAGRVLSHFSEEELNDALEMLLDIGTGGVDMLMAGLAKLQLPESRRAAVRDRVIGKIEPGPAPADAHRPESATVERLDHILNVAGNPEAELEALRAFELAVSEEDQAEFEAVVLSVTEADDQYEELKVHSDLLRLSADSTVVSSLLRRSQQLFYDLESRGGAASLAHWIAYYARIAVERQAKDPDVADAIRSMLAEHVTPIFIQRVAAIETETDGEHPLVTIICSLGDIGVGAFVESLAVEQERSARNRLLRSLEPRAPEFAPHLVDYLAHPQWFVVRNVLRLIGYGGAGYEDVVAGCLDHENARVVREALVALARFGTPRAVEHVRNGLAHASPTVRREAAQAIWRFEPDVAHSLALAALSNRDLAALDPLLLAEMCQAAARRDMEGLRDPLRTLRWGALHPLRADRRRLGRVAFRLARRARQ